MSSPTKAKKVKDEGEISQADARLYREMLRFSVTKPETDWEQVAVNCNYANAAVARARIYHIAKRDGWVSNVNLKKTKAADRIEPGDADHDEEQSPNKKKKTAGRPRKKKEVSTKQEEAGKDQIEDEIFAADGKFEKDTKDLGVGEGDSSVTQFGM